MIIDILGEFIKINVLRLKGILRVYGLLCNVCFLLSNVLNVFCRNMRVIDWLV